MGKVTDERCTERHQGETQDSVHGVGKTLRNRQGPATKHSQVASTTLLGQI